MRPAAKYSRPKHIQRDIFDVSVTILNFCFKKNDMEEECVITGGKLEEALTAAVSSDDVMSGKAERATRRKFDSQESVTLLREDNHTHFSKGVNEVYLIYTHFKLNTHLLYLEDEGKI